MPRYPRSLSSKLPKVGTTIFTVMSAMAQKHGAINLSQGFPDFASPPELIDLAQQHMKSGKNQYAPMTGALPLREAIAEKAESLYGCRYDVETEVTVTAGATQAIFTAISALIGSGDEVIVFEPVYDSYIPAIELNGGKAVVSRLSFPEYRPDWAEVRRLISDRTRMIIINSPHNPTGSILERDDLLELERLVADTDIVIVSDEVYEHIVFDGQRHESVTLYPGLAERSFVVSSFGKTYHVTGWKIAYCLAPRELMAEFRKTHQFNVFCVNSPAQYALADFMKQTSWYGELRDMYRQKRDFFQQLLSGTKFELLPCRGTYFQCVRYGAISDQPDTRFVEWLTREIGVAAIPVSAFYPDGDDHQVIRFCFAKSEQTLTQAAERLGKI